MAKRIAEYRPSVEQQALIERYFGGDRSREVVDAINRMSMADPNFAAHFKRIQAQMKSMRGSGDAWSDGTDGYRMSGNNAQARFSKGANAWNQYRMSRAAYGYGNAPTSPGGFKASGRDEDSALRRSGTMSSDAAKSAVSFGRKGVDFNGQTITKAQVDAIMRRGLSGATMNWRDQAIYDSLIGYGTTLDEAYAKRKAEIGRERAVARKAAEEERRIRDTDNYNRLRLGIGRGYDLTPEQMAAIREGRATFRNGQFLTHEDVRKMSSMREKSAADAASAREKSRKEALEYASKLVKDGTHEWTKSQQEAMRKLQDEIDRVSSDGSMNADAKARTRAELEQRLYDIRTNPHERMVPEETNDDNFAKNTRTDERGIVWAKDSNGSWKVAYNPKDVEAEYNRAKLEDDRKIAAQKRADERADAVQKRKDTWLDARIKDLMADKKGLNADKTEKITIPGLSYDKAYEQAMKEMDIRFPKTEEEVDSDETVDIPVPSAASQQGKYGFDWASASQVPLTEDKLERLDEMRVGNELAKEYARRRRDERLAEEEASRGQSAELATSPSNPVADKWAHRAMGGDANTGVPAQTEDEMLTPQSEEEIVPGGNCPECGAQLDEFGNCNVCGWPDEQAVASWKLENGIE